MDQFENAQRQRQPTSTIGLADSVGRDLRYSFRSLLRRPTFTLAAVLTLALGIGANTAVFSVVNAVLLKPLSYPQSNELVSLQHVAPGLNSGALGLSPDLYFTYRDENRTFEHLGVFTDGGATVTGVGDPEQARIRVVSDGVLQALGVQPMLGRWFSEADHAPQAAGPVFQFGDTVILTYAYWQRKFGGDPGVIGRSMSIDSRPTEIVGVMPAGFRFLNMTPEAELILPAQFDRSRVVLAGFGFLQGIGRLKPGVTLADAQADAARMLPIWLDAWPAAPGGAQRDAVANWRVAPAFVALKDTIVGNIASTLWVLMGTIGAVFVIACANVANLMLVRADARRQEFAVRAALGAGRGRIAKELLVESTVLGALGGAAGLALAYVGLRLLVAFGPTNSAAASRNLDRSVRARVRDRRLARVELAARLDPGVQARGASRGAALGGPRRDREPRASSSAQRARRGAGGARARADRLLRPDVPHVQRAARCRSRRLAARGRANRPDQHHPGDQHRSGTQHANPTADSRTPSGDTGSRGRVVRLRRADGSHAHAARRLVRGRPALRGRRDGADTPIPIRGARLLRDRGYAHGRGARHHVAGYRRGRQGCRDFRGSRARALGRARGRARQARPRIAAGCTGHLARRHRRRARRARGRRQPGRAAARLLAGAEGELVRAAEDRHAGDRLRRAQRARGHGELRRRDQPSRVGGERRSARVPRAYGAGSPTPASSRRRRSRS